MRVLYLLPTLEIGGMEKHVLLLAASLNRERFSPSLAVLQSGGPLESEFIQRGIVPQHLYLSKPYRIKTIFALRRLFRRERPDIVHTYLCGFDFLVGLASWGLPLRAVFSRRELFEWRRAWQWRVEQFGSCFAHRVIACSEAVRRQIADKERVPAVKLSTVYNGVAGEDPGFVASEARPVRVLGMVSNFGPEKDQATLIRAFALLAPKYTELTLVFTGAGRGLAAAKDLVKDLGLDHRVRFPGATWNVSKALQELDIFVFASRAEGLPNVILEAFAAGKPVVASNVGGVPEAVEHRKTGLLVEPGNPAALAQAVETLMQSEELRRALAANARDLVQRKFSINRMRDAYEQIYDDLLRGG